MKGPTPPTKWLRLSLQLVFEGFRRPTTAAALMTIAWRFRRRRWYRQSPFLPLPDADYVRWRMLTAYGDANAIPSASDVLRYARWATRD